MKIYTIGHSLHTREQFLALLGQHQISAIVDVRTRPASARAPQFNQGCIKVWLKENGISYVPLGEQLGGMPVESKYYDEKGHVLYNLMLEADWFQAGIARLIDGAKRYKIAMMCSENDPCICHRHNLIAPALHAVGVEVLHIQRDGSLTAFADGALLMTVGRSPKPMRKP